MFNKSTFVFLSLVALSPLIGDPNIIQVTTNDGGMAPGSLNDALQQLTGDDIIDCSPIAGQTILLGSGPGSLLPAIGHNPNTQTPTLTILGTGVTIDGGNIHPIFSLGQGSATITGFTIQNGLSKGGNGGSGLTGGGGGTGGGGALYIHTGTVLTISTLALNSNQAEGGNGGAGSTGGSGGGGGGFGGGNGGQAITTGANAGSGGGGGGNNGGETGGRDGGVGIPNTFPNYGGAGGGGENDAGTRVGAGGGTAASLGTPSRPGGAGASGGGGGGAGAATDVPPTPLLGGDGFPGSSVTSGVGGAGGFGFGVNYTYGVGGAGGGINGGGGGYGASGGGAGYLGPGGNGGTLGGGGGASHTGAGGNGGFGAGGGAGNTGGIDPNGLGGSGGSGAGLSAGGGGGSGLGGAIYIQTGGQLILQDGISFSGNSTTAGLGGTATGAPGGNGSSLGQDIFIQAGGNLTFQIDGTLTLSNPIEGAGSSSTTPGLVMSGTGTALLNGTNTYLGGTSIQSGTLNLNGSVAGDVTIASSGKLSGNATVNGTLNSSGKISPGNSIGTVHTVNLVLQPTSVYDVELNSAGASDQIIASGSAEIAGGVFVIPDDLNFTAPVTYTIISSGTSVTGRFSSMSSTVPALISLIYDPLTVQLTYRPLAGLKGSALKAANCYVTTSGPDTAVINTALIGLSFDAIQKAFGQMVPSQFSSLTQVQLLNPTFIRSTYTRHLAQLCLEEDPCDRPITLWGDVAGQWQHQDKFYGYNDTTVGATVGADTRFHHFIFGGAVSYTHDNFHWHQSGGHANINSFYGGVYGRWNHEAFYINGAVIGAFNKYHTTRHLDFGSIERYAHSHHNGYDWLGNLGLGYQVSAPHFEWTPYLNLDYVYQHEQSYREQGAQSLDLHVHTKNTQLFQGEAGFLFSKTYCHCKGTFVPALKLAYINQTPLSSKNYSASFAGSSCTFSSEGRDFQRNLFAPGIVLTYQHFSSHADASLYYDAKVGSSYWEQDVGLNVTFHF